MSDPAPVKSGSFLDDPAVKQRIIRALLVIAAPLFAFSWAFTSWQGAPRWASLLTAAVAAAGCFIAAFSIHMLGSQARHVATAVSIILALAAFFFGGR